MKPTQFATKWGRTELRESQGSQEHFIDLCRLVGVDTPAEADPKGEFFTFEKSLHKDTGEPASLMSGGKTISLGNTRALTKI